jgi:hypothetical protein
MVVGAFAIAMFAAKTTSSLPQRPKLKRAG